MAEKYIPFFVPTIGNEEIREVAKVMKSGWITSGHVTEKFEKEFKNYIGCKYTAAVNSGTAALHLALDAIGLRPDDEVHNHAHDLCRNGRSNSLFSRPAGVC